MIIGLVGKKRSGKDTTGDFLTEAHNFIRYSFASPIKKIGEIVFGWDTQSIENNKEGVDPHYGISYREFYQWIGTEVFQYAMNSRWPEFDKRIGRGVWVHKFLKTIKKGKRYVITDMRFPHEDRIVREYCCEHGIPYITIRIERNGIESTDTHPSETEMDKILPTAVVYNNGTKQDLYKRVDEVIRKFMVGKGVQIV